MELYNFLGKGLLGLFVGLTSILSPAPLPKPEAVVLTPPEIRPIIASSTISTKINTPVATTTAVATSTKQKYISIYLNYPEKITVAPAKTFNQNFKQIFQYSPQQKPSSPLSQSQTENKQTTPSIGEVPAVTKPVEVARTNEIANNEVRAISSIVNVYCTIRIGNAIKAVTGSGVIVDPRGMLLTNAHVGEFPLLQGNSIAKNMTCSVRTGSPTSTSYGVRVIYISKNWINQHYRNISQSNFSETGENDIALLQIVDKQTGNTLSKTFTSIPLSYTSPTISEQVSIASYPANNLATNGVSAPLSVQTEQLRVVNAFSFANSPLADLVETSDATKAQHGSSGGALLNSSGDLAGLIVITVKGDALGTKHVRALTIRHIDDVLQEEIGQGLSSLLSQDPTNLYKQFELDRQSLIQRLIDGSAALFF